MSARDVIAGAGRKTGFLVNDKYREMTVAVGEDNADAILSALEAAGYAVVPKEPTKAMTEAASGAWYQHRSSTEMYRAMLTAAKETP